MLVAGSFLLVATILCLLKREEFGSRNFRTNGSLLNSALHPMHPSLLLVSRTTSHLPSFAFLFFPFSFSPYTLTRLKSTAGHINNCLRGHIYVPDQLCYAGHSCAMADSMKPEPVPKPDNSLPPLHGCVRVPSQGWNRMENAASVKAWSGLCMKAQKVVAGVFQCENIQVSRSLYLSLLHASPCALFRSPQLYIDFNIVYSQVYPRLLL